MITAAHDESAGPLAMPWRNCIAVGRAFELIRDDGLTHLRRCQREIGYRYCRFHALFNDEMDVVTREKDGTLTFRWYHVDRVLDALLAMGIRPFIELNPIPGAIASGEKTMFWYRMNVTPPAKVEEWGQLVEAFARHVIARHGLSEVRQWYFEVWNEPNLASFWAGTQQDYFDIYDAAARALKHVDAGLRVGGPASAQAGWISEIIDHCVDNDVPIDFISTHSYPQDEYARYKDREGSPHELGQFFIDKVRGVKDTVRASKRPDLEIHWTEWNAMSCASTESISWIRNPTNDSLYGAAHIVRNMLALDDAADTLTWWVASDVFEEGGPTRNAFSCRYGLLTIHGIPKAHYNAFMLLNKMIGDRMALAIDTPPPTGCGGCVTRDAQVLHALLHNHHYLEIDDQPAWSDTIRMQCSSDQAHRVVAVRIRAGAGSPWESWVAMGRPGEPTRTELDLLRAHATPEYSLQIVEPREGNLEMAITVGPGEVLYLEATPLSLSSGERDASGVMAGDLEHGLGLIATE